VDGSNATFTLSAVPDPLSSLTVYRNGLLQKPGQDYSVNGNSVQFVDVAIPQPGDTLLVSFRSPGIPAPPTLISPQQIDPSGLTAGQVWLWDGNSFVPGSVVDSTASYTDPNWLTISKDKVGLSNVENIALSNWPGTSSLTTVGTLTTGTVPWALLSGVPSTFVPTSHAGAHAMSGTDPVTPAAIGAVASSTRNQSNGYVGLDASGNAMVGTTQITTAQQIDVLCSGDITATLQAAITALGNASGGIVRLSSGACYSTTKLTFVTDATTPVGVQKPLRITGAGAYHFWQKASTNAPSGGTTLDLRYSDATALIDTRGSGRLELDHFTLWTSQSISSVFIQTTNTHLHVHDMAIIGTPSKTGALATTNQVGIALGGTDTSGNQGMLPGSPFTGYPSIVENNFFDHVSTGVAVRRWANGNIIRGNGWGYDNGGTAAITIDGRSGSGDAQANVITDNLIEMGSYVYGIQVVLGTNNWIAGNSFYDLGAGTLAYIRFETGGCGNQVTTNQPAVGSAVRVSDSCISGNAVTGRNAQSIEFGEAGVGVGATANATSGFGFRSTVTTGRGFYGSSSTGNAIYGDTTAGVAIYGSAAGAGVAFEGDSVNGTSFLASSSGTGDMFAGRGNGGTTNFRVTNGGNVVAAGAYYSAGLGGLTVVKNLKGSSGNNCTMTFTGGLLTATTCP